MRHIAFIFHFIVTLGAWVFPFLVQWPIVIGILGAVMLQFAIFGKCLVNEHHGLVEDADSTFYSELLEKMGFQPNRTKLKFFIRRVLYPVLSVVAILWQVVLGHEPLLF